MYWYCRAFLLSFFAIVGTTAAMAAAPNVTLRLDAALVHVVNGKVTTSAVDRPLKAGDVIEYRIVARNAGNASALAFSPLGKVPAHTEFLQNEGASRAARASYTLDGTHWSEHPMVRAVKSSGHVVMEPAPRSLYRAVRWTLSGALVPSQTATFAYEVRVQ